MKCIKPRHHKLTYEINTTTINDFHLLVEERRQLRYGKVKNIMASLERDVHFESDIVVNKINMKFRVIDGNHRLEAIKNYLKKHPKNKVKVYLAKYENLSLAQEKKMRENKIRKEERKIYSVWNKGVQETATDYLKQYFKTIEKGEEMLRKLPATIYHTETTMSLKLLVGNHITAKKQKKFDGGYSAGGEKTVEDFNEIDSNDIKIIQNFCKDMEEIFGKYYRKNPYYRTTPLASFYRLWYDNRKKISREKLIKAFKSVFLDRWAEINELSTHGGRSATITFYKLCIERLNSYRKKLQFVADIDLIKIQDNESFKGV